MTLTWERCWWTFTILATVLLSFTVHQNYFKGELREGENTLTLFVFFSYSSRKIIVCIHHFTTVLRVNIWTILEAIVLLTLLIYVRVFAHVPVEKSTICLVLGPWYYHGSWVYDLCKYSALDNMMVHKSTTFVNIPSLVISTYMRLRPVLVFHPLWYYSTWDYDLSKYSVLVDITEHESTIYLSIPF